MRMVGFWSLVASNVRANPDHGGAAASARCATMDRLGRTGLTPPAAAGRGLSKGSRSALQWPTTRGLSKLRIDGVVVTNALALNTVALGLFTIAWVCCWIALH